ncbi:hypothetical protein E2C01_089319 [Portunus trituberculatus]|uniref:Uncharacterized protein n=1 Tax=Portunus trituberculatus TaxID=210409 RepID=A0A5B7JD76_PORTR|nr:hypothetical protein [Portunus trituberculatus]
MTCYEVHLKEKQQKKKQQSITSFFRPHTPSQVTESETYDDNGDTSEEESSGGGSGGDGGGDGDGGGSGSGARTPLSLTLEGEAVQPRDEVDVLGVTFMRVAWLLDGKGLEVLYKAQVCSFILKKKSRELSIHSLLYTIFTL